MNPFDESGTPTRASWSCITKSWSGIVTTRNFSRPSFAQSATRTDPYHSVVNANQSVHDAGHVDESADHAVSVSVFDVEIPFRCDEKSFDATT
jgi:hypothetical protein